MLITSDHGFLYTAKPLQENDKVDRSDFGGKEVEYARRYAIMQKGASPEYLMPIKFWTERNTMGLRRERISELK